MKKLLILALLVLIVLITAQTHYTTHDEQTQVLEEMLNEMDSADTEQDVAEVLARIPQALTIFDLPVYEDTVLHGVLNDVEDHEDFN